MCRAGISYIERDIGFCRWRQQVIRRRGGGFITKTVFEEGCVSVRWHIERRKRLAKGERSFLSERRQAAELARTGHMTRLICAGIEMRTHHAFMMGSRAKFVTFSCLRA